MMDYDGDDWLGEISVCAFCSKKIYDIPSTCSYCKSVLYCTDACLIADQTNTLNIDYSHDSWCNILKIIMSDYQYLSNFPFSFANQTTHPHFSRSHLLKYLENYGIYELGLWKYLFCHAVGGPGSEMSQWDGLVTVASSCSTYGCGPILRCLSAREDVALLKAYVNPSDAVLLSVTPDSPSSAALWSQGRHLTSWSSYYAWRGLPLTSPLALLLHWPLTVYFILSNLLPLISLSSLENIFRVGHLTLHLIGVESEADLLPVFKELDLLLPSSISRITMILIGPLVSASVHLQVYELSSRFVTQLWRGLYHDYVNSVNSEHLDRSPLIGTEPDIIIAFNAGVAAYSTWPETLAILAEKTTFFTDSCQYSCLLSWQVLRRLNLTASTGLEDPKQDLERLITNPFRSPLRIPSASVCWPWFSNAFIYAPFHELSLTRRMSELCV